MVDFRPTFSTCGGLMGRRCTDPDPAVERLLTELEEEGVAPSVVEAFAKQALAREIAWELFRRQHMQ